jgi:hypothetical protein
MHGHCYHRHYSHTCFNYFFSLANYRTLKIPSFNYFVVVTSFAIEASNTIKQQQSLLDDSKEERREVNADKLSRPQCSYLARRTQENITI